MIYGKSRDAILIKKITLHVWPLRQEVEQRIQERLEHGESKEAIIKSLQNANFVAAEFPPAEENKTAETTATENQGETANDEHDSADDAVAQPLKETAVFAVRPPPHVVANEINYLGDFLHGYLFFWAPAGGAGL